MMPSICFVGLTNLPVLAREYNQHGIGGEQVQHTLLARALARRGYPVSMLVADYGQPDGAKWDGITTHRAYRLDAGVYPVALFHPRWTGLRAAAQRADADIYYVSCANIQVGQIVQFAHARGRAAMFRVAHDYDCIPDKLIIPRDRFGLSYAVNRGLYEYGLARADVILAQTEQQRAALRSNYQLESDIATMLVEHPAGVTSFAQRDLDVLWVNNIRQFKRPDVLLDLARAIPGTNVHLVGGRQEGFDALYDQIAGAAPAIANLTFHGQVPYHDVNDLYARAKVFVNTSDMEGFPNSYLQAWARGTPVIAFFDPDGVIAREGLGRAVKDLEEMRAAVLELTQRPERWAEVSARCRAYMTREYDEDRILRPYLAAIDRLASRRGAA